MSSPDQQNAPSRTGIPTPPAGVGASDLVTETTDPEELRELLDRARDRLSFYESFDKIIGENIRRSGELMVETVALREQTRTQSAEFARERAEFEMSRQQDRETYRALIQGAMDEVAATKASLDGIMTRLEGALSSLGDDAAADASPGQTEATTSALVEPWTTGTTDPEARTEDIPDEVAPSSSVEPVETDEESVTTEPEAPAEDSGPRAIDILVQNVANAATAISLQKHLRELEAITSVDAREFANGVLRLHVDATAAITEPDLASWLRENNGSIASSSASVVEITLGDPTSS